MKKTSRIKNFITSVPALTSISLKLYLIYLKVTRKDLLFGTNIKVGLSSTMEGRNHIGSNSIFIGSEIGYASYISENSFFQDTKIGKYCSIGPNVNCIFGKHPANTFVSTHPAFFSVRKQVGFSYVTEQYFDEFAEKKQGFAITIGNDVWIGANVSIMDGVTIGDGAIVAANTLVNKDVQPYTIVGGVPAKNIRLRFKESEIQFLLKFKWWEKKESWISKNVSKFRNVEDFINCFENDR